MAMTRQDYTLIAAALNEALEDYDTDDTMADTDPYDAREGVTNAIMVLTLHLERANPRFDRRRFLDAAYGSSNV